MAVETFGQFIWRKRKEMNLSRDALASKLSISHSHLNNLERGTRYPSRELVRVFARELDVPSENLFQLLVGEEENQSSQNSLNNNEDEPEYLVAFNNDPNLPPEIKEAINRIVRDQYATAKRNAEELKNIPEGINRPAKKPE